MARLLQLAPVALALAAGVACDIEDYSRTEGETCFELADCVEECVCDLDREICRYEDGSRLKDESCVIDADCKKLPCYDDFCQKAPSGGGGGGGGDCPNCIICNDGTRSPSCTTCSQGCCSGHGGCL